MPPRRMTRHRSASRQRGAILVVSMLVLTVLTLLALGASQTLRMQERMATALRERDVAFQAAEAALRAGERVVSDPSLTSAPTACAADRCRIYARDVLGAPAALQPADWWRNRAWPYTAAPNEPADQDARFVVEEFAQIPDTLTISPDGPRSGRTYYRITSMGRASADAAQVILQSTFARRFTSDMGTAVARIAQREARLPAQRQIVTTNTDGTPVAFRWAALDASRKAQLEDAALVDRLRGDAAAESTLPATQPDNGQRFGTTFSSAPLFVGAPRFRYRDSALPLAYSRFVATHSKRPGMLYAAMNDGMVHGFDASTGVEVFAFVPSPVFARLRDLAPKTSEPVVIGAQPSMADVPFADAWHTILVGGLNQGGQGIYALDITAPSSFTTAEAKPASLVLWEFTDADDADLGSTYSQPIVARLQDGTWAAIFGNGYGSQSADGSASTTGNAVLYIVNAATGDVIRKLDTGVGVAHTPVGIANGNGLSTPAVTDTNDDGIADCVYAGDLYGNLWKFDLSAKHSADWNVAWGGKPLYRARNANGNPQPITTRSEVARSPDGAGVIVLFGTGEPAGLARSPAQQSIYGIVDHNVGAIADRGELQAQTITSALTVDPDGAGPVAAATVRTTSHNDLSARSGWYIDLPDPGEKLLLSPNVIDGKVIFSTVARTSDPKDVASRLWTWSVDVRNGGGSADRPPFDLDRDGQINSHDTVTTTANDKPTPIAVSAVAFSTAPETAWQSVIVADASSGTTCDRQIYSSGAIQRLASVTLRCGLGDTGRQSWRQLR